MKNATFYLLNQASLNLMEWLACYFTVDKWREGKLVLIACEDEAQALRIDEALWACDPDTFVPHNLTGECSPYGTPVEICWQQRRGSNMNREVLISLLLSVYADFASSFNEVIDFVPAEATLKQLARNRYKTYRSVGFQLTTAIPPR
ncbi:DNA polymerase III subunit chi [Candidatus Moranella endobia PCVAL]|uniref:DNA polymerase III subunit chi n=1 Tax=Candidatus Moranella endobia TaxID=1048758 RepID=UPI0002C69BBB|nr:DNA polymerase III subunit chi [Candidatus Moranella endobia]AGJ61313.1 DNA polymerase III subunit chi [Candidatus Moranella endobia PCVAL]